MPKPDPKRAKVEPEVPRFPAGLSFERNGIATDAAGKLWLLDVEAGTIKAVTVEGE